MILRNIAIRQGRKALAPPLRRCLSTADAARSERLAIIDKASKELRKMKRNLRRSGGESIYTAEEVRVQLDKLRLEKDAMFSAIPVDTFNYEANNERLAGLEADLKQLYNYQQAPQEILDREGIESTREEIAADIKVLELERAKILIPRKKKGVAYKTYKEEKHDLLALGSVVSPVYQPQQLITQAPKPEHITLELLMASQTHMGHNTALWNPANQRYIYGVRQGIHIISLEQTAAHLRRAAKVVEGVAYHGGLILFVGTRPGVDRAVVQAAKNARGCHLFERWIPGTITNGDVILVASGKKAVDELDKKIESSAFVKNLEEHKSLKPDLVVCLNPLENYVCLKECANNDIPTIGVIDTDADPTWVTYPIPANDDSVRSINLIAGVLGRAGESGQKKRLEAARTGTVTWTTHNEYKEWAKEDKVWMAQLQADMSEKQQAERMQSR